MSIKLFIYSAWDGIKLFIFHNHIYKVQAIKIKLAPPRRARTQLRRGAVARQRREMGAREPAAAMLDRFRNMRLQVVFFSCFLADGLRLWAGGRRRALSMAPASLGFSPAADAHGVESVEIQG